MIDEQDLANTLYPFLLFSETLVEDRFQETYRKAARKMIGELQEKIQDRGGEILFPYPYTIRKFSDLKIGDPVTIGEVDVAVEDIIHDQVLGTMTIVTTDGDEVNGEPDEDWDVRLS